MQFQMWVWVKIQDLGDDRHSQFLVSSIQLLGYPILTRTVSMCFNWESEVSDHDIAVMTDFMAVKGNWLLLL